jgi:hypothetical protein
VLGNRKARRRKLTPCLDHSRQEQSPQTWLDWTPSSASYLAIKMPDSSSWFTPPRLDIRFRKSRRLLHMHHPFPHISYSIIIPRGLSSVLLCHIWYKAPFVLWMDIIVLPVWNKGPYGLLRLDGYLGLTYNSCCVAWGHPSLAVLHPYCLRMWVGYNGVQATAQQGMVVMSPLYSLSIVSLYSIVLCR